MRFLTAESIGDAWLESLKCIFEEGNAAKDGKEDLRELLHFVVSIKKPDEDDILVKKYGDHKMIEWMLSNFLEQKRVPELKNALSYGTRMFNYEGKNQIEWVVAKLSCKPESKAATIPLIMPGQDEGYIPCVSMLDFKIRDNKLMLVSMCRAIDFGKKVYANMIALHRIQKMVADRLGLKPGDLVMYVVSAHVYAQDYNNIKGILEEYKEMKISTPVAVS